MNKAVLLAGVSLVLVLVSACSDITQPPDDESVVDSYIVEVVDGVNPETVADDHGIVPHYVYTDALNGFAAVMSDAKKTELSMDARVKEIEPDEIEVEETVQTGATWGLDRTDQRSPDLDKNYSYTSTGSGVTVYIIDTGILLNHTEFGSRATKGYDALTLNGNASDCNGHVTHVASTVGGTRYGIAKAVNLVSVRVLDCHGSGTMSGVIAGVNWVTAHRAPNAVVNMSLGGSVSRALDDAVAASIASGVTYVLAAGNNNGDACNISPARAPAAITVGATDISDRKATFSNFGSCLDIFAPGVAISGAWIGSTTATNTISGTSMAAPHVAGVAALFLSQHPGAAPQQVRDAIVGNATPNAVSNAVALSPNLLLYSNY